jgi:hypothetical protein
MPAAVVVTAKYGCCEADTQPNIHRQQNSSMSGEHDLPAYPVPFSSSTLSRTKTAVNLRTVVTVLVVVHHHHYEEQN